MKSLAWLSAFATGLVFTWPVLAQTVPIESLRQRQGITITGTVGSVVGNSFTLSDGTGEIIVDAGPRWYQQIDVVEGERLVVVGEFDNGEFDAYNLTRANGEVIVVRNGPGRPLWAGGPNRAR
ncbi:MAG TPA: DNA-binding protein [Oscillatoriales cyanobacterium M4454_W2019_049]|nr:DNA-binding protein [Oscillatoriales cyanobacterium M4454_W2019_049]